MSDDEDRKNDLRNITHYLNKIKFELDQERRREWRKKNEFQTRFHVHVFSSLSLSIEFRLIDVYFNCFNFFIRLFNSIISQHPKLSSKYNDVETMLVELVHHILDAEEQRI